MAPTLSLVEVLQRTYVVSSRSVCVTVAFVCGRGNIPAGRLEKLASVAIIYLIRRFSRFSRYGLFLGPLTSCLVPLSLFTPNSRHYLLGAASCALLLLRWIDRTPYGARGVVPV